MRCLIRVILTWDKSITIFVLSISAYSSFRSWCTSSFLRRSRVFFRRFAFFFLFFLLLWFALLFGFTLLFWLITCRFFRFFLWFSFGVDHPEFITWKIISFCYTLWLYDATFVNSVSFTLEKFFDDTIVFRSWLNSDFFGFDRTKFIIYFNVVSFLCKILLDILSVVRTSGSLLKCHLESSPDWTVSAPPKSLIVKVTSDMNRFDP